MRNPLSDPSPLQFFGQSSILSTLYYPCNWYHRHFLHVVLPELHIECALTRPSIVNISPLHLLLRTQRLTDVCSRCVTLHMSLETYETLLSFLLLFFSCTYLYRHPLSSPCLPSLRGVYFKHLLTSRGTSQLTNVTGDSLIVSDSNRLPHGTINSFRREQ